MEEDTQLLIPLLPALVFDKEVGHMIPQYSPRTISMNEEEISMNDEISESDPFIDGGNPYRQHYEEDTCFQRKCPQCNIS